MFWSYAMHIFGSVPYLSSFPPFFSLYFSFSFFLYLSLSFNKKGILQLLPKISLFHFYIFQNYNLNHYHKCVVITFQLTFTAACGTLIALAFQRYLAIVRPLENKKRRTVKNANILQTLVWTGMLDNMLSYISRVWRRFFYWFCWHWST